MAKSKGMDGAQVLVLVDLGENGQSDWQPCAEQTNLSTETTRNLIEASSKDSDHAKWLYGKQESSVSLEKLYTPNDSAFMAIEDAMNNRETVVLRRTENGKDIEEATALVESISKEFPDDDASTCEAEFQLNERWRVISDNGNGEDNGEEGQ